MKTVRVVNPAFDTMISEQASGNVFPCEQFGELKVGDMFFDVDGENGSMEYQSAFKRSTKINDAVSCCSILGLLKKASSNDIKVSGQARACIGMLRRSVLIKFDKTLRHLNSSRLSIYN
jgi:hypothetical protein